MEILIKIYHVRSSVKKIHLCLVFQGDSWCAICALYFFLFIIVVFRFAAIVCMNEINNKERSKIYPGLHCRLLIRKKSLNG